MLEKDSGMPIQGMPLGYGLNATSPYTVQGTDSVVEFTETGTVTVTFEGGATRTTSVLAGSRYAIVRGTTTVTFNGLFNIG